MKNPLVIGICGGSASGKTYLKDLLIKNSPTGKTQAFTLDSYYLPREWQKADENGYLNFDLPEALNTEKMILDFLDLSSGFSIEQPVYQYNNKNASIQFNILEPAPVIIAEGIFLFHYKEFLDRINIKVFVDAPFEIKKQRRLERDIKERGYEEKEIQYRFDVHAEDSFKKYVLPHKNQADWIIEKDSDFEKTCDYLLKRILEY